ERVPVAGADQAAVAEHPLRERVLLVGAERVGHDEPLAQVEDQVGPTRVLDRPALAAVAGAQRHFGGYRHASSTEPIRSTVATTTSPAETGTAAVRPPER